MQTRFTSKQAAELCGVPYPTLSFLRARGLVTPSVRAGENKGAASVWDVYDVALLRCLAELRAVPATFDTMKGVIECCRTPEARAVIEANRFDGKVDGPVPDKNLLIIKGNGTAELAGDCKVSELFSAGENAEGTRAPVVLHIVDLARLAHEVSMDVTALQIVEGNAVPGPKGRLPLVGRKKMKRRGEKRRAPSSAQERRRGERAREANADAPKAKTTKRKKP